MNIYHVMNTIIIAGAAQNGIVTPVAMEITIQIVSGGMKYWEFLPRLPLKKLGERGMTKYRRIILTEWLIWIVNLRYWQINERRN